MKKKLGSASCPCGSGKPLETCCGRLHGGEAATDAEALMRSRYTAYALGLEDYLLATWHPDTRPARLGLGDGAPPKWLGLTVLHHRGLSEDQAEVGFVARYKIGGKAGRLAETSRFSRLEGRWYYLDGNVED